MCCAHSTRSHQLMRSSWVSLWTTLWSSLQDKVRVVEHLKVFLAACLDEQKCDDSNQIKRTLRFYRSGGKKGLHGMIMYRKRYSERCLHTTWLAELYFTKATFLCSCWHAHAWHAEFVIPPSLNLYFIPNFYANINVKKTGFNSTKPSSKCI